MCIILFNFVYILIYLYYSTIGKDEYENKKIIEKLGCSKQQIRIALFYQISRQIIITFLLGFLFSFILYYSTLFITWEYINTFINFYRLLDAVVLPFYPYQSVIIIITLNIFYILCIYVYPIFLCRC